MRESVSVESFDQLSGLDYIQGTFTFDGNALLRDLSGFRNTEGALSSLWVQNNGNLRSLDGLEKISDISGNLRISGNKKLTSISGLRGIRGAVGSIRFTGNAKLTSLNGLEGITSVGAYDGRSISSTGTALLEITALDRIEGSLTGSLQIWNNEVLESPQGILGIHSAVDSVYIMTNPSMCATPQEAMSLRRICTNSNVHEADCGPVSNRDWMLSMCRSKRLSTSSCSLRATGSYPP